MKKLIAILLLFISFSASSQIVNKFRDSTWFAKGVRFDSAIYLIKGASNGKVLTSDASGRATWQTFSSSGVSQGALNDSINAVRSIRKVDTLYRNLDSLVFKINGIRYAIKDSSGGGVTQQALDDSIARLDSTINTLQTSLNDTANVLRGLIPEVSTYATITNLKDSTSLLRSLIPQTPTFSLSKNSAKDSIVTVFNGIRSAVKDSVANLTNYVTTSSTSILTNKRITARVDSTTSSATPTINTDNVDTYKLTAQSVDITSFTTNLSGTPTDDQILHIVIIGTATRAITWGSKFESSTVALPTTTSGTTRLDVYFIWNTATSKWRCGGVW